MKISLIKLSIITFTLICIKRILFHEWEFQSVDFNSIEMLLLVSTLGFSLYYWIKVATDKTIVKRSIAIVGLTLCTFILYNKLPSNHEIIDRIELSDNEEIRIHKLSPELCLGDLDYCTDSIKVTKYKIFQKKEIM